MKSDPSTLGSLARQVSPFSKDTPVETVAQAFLDSRYQNFLSIAIVDKDVPIGSISRHTLNQIFLQRYGRELYGNRCVSGFMNQSPLRIPISSSLTDAANYLTQNMQLPLTEDFILTDTDDHYCGMGGVLDLLHAVKQQLQYSQMQLIQSEKMSAIGLLTAGIAHEINTPLGYVRNNIDLLTQLCLSATQCLPRYEQILNQLQQSNILIPQIQEQLQQLNTDRQQSLPDSWAEDLQQLSLDTIYGVEQITELVQGLKDFSRQDSDFQEQADFNSCVEKSLRLANSFLRYNIQIIQQLQPLPPLRLQPSPISQVLLNLLTNAAQAMPNGGKIVLKSWVQEDWACFSVEDTGHGITKEHLHRIFDPFFTTKPMGQGTGLGLFISYQILQQHKGRIQVTSNPGIGSCFTIQLPLNQYDRQNI